MKTQTMNRIIGCLFSILLLNSSFAQSGSKRSPLVLTDAEVKASGKILTQFNKSFPNAENVRWYEFDKNLLVTFFMNDMEQRVLLTRKSNIIYHISYGLEKHLPTEVRRIIKSTYFDYNITKAIKVQEDNRTVWIVNMEDNQSLISVFVEDREMGELKHLKKSN